MIGHVRRYSTVANDDGTVTVYCGCGLSKIHDTETDADRAVSNHHAEQVRNNGLPTGPARPGRRWSNREIDAVLARIHAAAIARMPARRDCLR
jgi:hypothetical protein